MAIGIAEVVKVLVPAAGAFFVGIAVTPYVTDYLYKKQAWKKVPGNREGLGDDMGTPIFNELHKEKEVGTPRMGGIVIVLAVSLTVAGFWVYSYFTTGGPSGKLDFLSRTQTWLPFAAFLIGAVIGGVEDVFVIKQTERFPDGLPFVYRATLTSLFGLFAAWWFFSKLGVTSTFVPFVGEIALDFWFIPFFLIVLLGLLASGIIDGIDGLSGGVFAIIFSAYGVIAFFQNQFNIAAFSFVIVGALLAFLWFNIPPARFFMGESGFMAIMLALLIIAFATNQVLVLPIVAFIPTATVVTTLAQVIAKKFFKKKLFLVAPIHHHFEAIGWPAYKVVMRYWVLSAIVAVLGVVVALVG